MNATSNKKTMADRKYETRKCLECEGDYEAPVKIIGKGVIGGGLCKDCLRASRPSRTAQCPVCNNPFKIQAGHDRKTCGRACEKIYTLQKWASEDREKAAERLRTATELQQQKAEAEAAKRRAVVEAFKAGQSQQKAAEAEAQKNAPPTPEQLAQAYQSAKGTRLERLGNVSKVVRRSRKALTEPAGVTVAA